ncbi:MAG TPA: BTAD domain-containing putative transcriptional regulator [Candidatus Sulfomarinibacteraceae bacterium]|nr:BTAD domain-containing putative transcriptional regulator [Candidatus Sulfomarinibacteraceae bacterium]
MSTLSLRLFGPPRIEVNGKVVKVTRRKAVALLAYLAVTEQSHSRGALAAMLWPETDQSRALASLRSALWSLNKTALAQWVAAEGETVALRPLRDDGEAALEVDVVRFRALLAAAQAHDHAGAGCADCAAILARAAALYEGDFLAGFSLADAPAFDEWHFFEANDLREGLAAALRRLIAWHRGRGDADCAVHYARRLVGLDPLDEAAQRVLMELYAEAGQQRAAVRQYEMCREALAAELGVEPAAETRALYERIRSGAWEADEAAERATTGGDGEGVIPHNLPPEPTQFIGREQERAALAAFLEEEATRLVTITGPGGSGKTRLALASAAAQVVRSNFADGVYFVPLAPLSDPEAIVPAIAEAAGYPFQPDKRSPRQQVFDFLSQKSMLLLLDNFEHLLGEEQADGAAFVADLLQHAPQVKILATSREPLNLYEEQRYPLEGLGVASGEAGTDYAAAALFLETVRRRQPAFEVAPEEASSLAEICRLVAGMPLALELSASWIEVLSLREIAAEIRKGLSLLETSVRNVPARHRSMQAVFDTSWQALGEAEQTLYAQLSVFRGGFTPEAASAVTGASRQALVGLVHKSLLHFNRTRGRYENHELLRQYAAEKLAGATAEKTLGSHAAYYCAFLQEWESDLKGPRQQEALAEIEADHENAIAAWQWCVERSRIERLGRALDPLCFFYQRRGRFEEGEAVCGLAVEGVASGVAGGESGPPDEVFTAEGGPRGLLLAMLLVWQARFNIFLGRFERARELLGWAQRVLEQLDVEGPAFTEARAFLLLHLSDPSITNEFGGKSEALNEECLRLYRSIGDPWATALALDVLSQKKMNLGLHEQAIRLHKECLAIREGLGDTLATARSYSLLGLMVLHIGQLQRSGEYLRKSLSLFRTMDNRADMSVTLALLGVNLLFEGKFEECLASYEESWAIHRKLGIATEPHTANVGMTRAMINLGRYEEARRQAQRDLETYRAVNHRWSVAFTLFNLARIDLVEGATERARRRCEESAGILQEMSERSLLPDVLFCLAYAFRALDERERAVEMMVEALRIVIETEPLNPMRFELPGMALLLADEGELERAIEFYAAALQSPYIANSRWFRDVAGRHIRKVAATLPPDVVADAEERGRARDLWETAKGLLGELQGEY